MEPCLDGGAVRHLVERYGGVPSFIEGTVMYMYVLWYGVLSHHNTYVGQR